MPYRIPRRHLVASLTALGFCGLLRHVRAAQAVSSEQTALPLAERLAAYADRLRYDDLDAATIERVKAHVIDALGCGIAAFDENPVRICREVALVTPQASSAPTGALHPTLQPSPMAPPSATTT